jgi:hypothetical protein
MSADIYEFLKDVGAAGAPLGAAFVAYLLGLRAYHLQREYELVRRRYLDEGLDAFAADVEHALGVFKNNWQHSLNVLKHYREMDAAMRRELIDTGWLDVEMSQFRVRPNYRVGTLVGDRVFWNIQQLLFAFVGTTTAFFKDDLGGAVRHAISGGALKGPKQTMIDEYVQQCEKHLDTANRYHILLGEVQAITTEFERKRFTLASVQKFKDREVVKSSVKRLKDAFADKLAKYEA